MKQHIKLFFGANAILKILGFFSILVVTPLFMQHLGVEDYGVYTYVAVWTGLLAFYGNFGLVEYVNAYGCVDKDIKNRQAIICSGYAGVLVLSFIASAIFLIGVTQGIIKVNLPFMFIILIVLGAVLNPLSHLGMHLLLGFSLLKHHYGIKIIGSILGMIAFLFLVLFEFSVWYFILWGVIYGALLVIAYIYILFKRHIFVFTAFDGRVLRQAVPISLVFAVNTGTLALLTFADKYLITYFLDIFSLGIYATALLMVQFIYGFVYAPCDDYFKGFIRTAVRTDNVSRVQYLLDVKMYLLLIILVPIFLSYAIYGQNFLQWYLGSEFIDAHGFALMLSMANVCNTITHNLFEVVILQDKKGNISLAYRNLLALIINVGLNVLWIPKYGVLGAVYATFVTAVILCGISVIFIQKKYAYKIVTPMFLGCVCIVVIVYGFGYTLWNPDYGIIWTFVYSGISLGICVLLSLVIPSVRGYAKIVLSGMKL